MTVELAGEWTPELAEAISLLVGRYGAAVAIRAEGMDGAAYKMLAESFQRLNVRVRWMHSTEEEIMSYASAGFVVYRHVLYFSRVGDVGDAGESFQATRFGWPLGRRRRRQGR